MRFPRLEYPRGQTFAVPYITESFYAISLVIIVVLAVLNTALVGSDIVTELKKNPNNADVKWWAPSWLPEFLTIPTTPGPCQPLTIPQNDPSIQTNSSVPLFTYAILNGFGQDQNQDRPESSGTKRVSQALPYRSEPLHNCSVREITAVLDFPTAGFRTKSLVVCDLLSTNSSAPQALKLLTTFSRVASVSLHFETDNVRNYISESPYTVPWPSDVREAHSIFSESPDQPDLAVLGILDAIGSDLLKAIWAQKRAWRLGTNRNEWPDQAVVKWAAQVNCTSWDKCRTKGDQVEGIEMWYSDTGGLQDFDAGYLRAMNTTLYNYFVVLRDALHLDLGTIDHNQNVFLNLDAFRLHILPDPFMSQIAPQVVGMSNPALASSGGRAVDEFQKTCTWAWGCLNGTWSGAILSDAPIAANITKGLPLRSFNSPYSTVIDVDFVCPTFKTKQTGSLLVSVFIGTFTMYTALYGFFIFIAPIFDRKYRRKHGLDQLSQCPCHANKLYANEIGESQYLLSGNGVQSQQSLPPSYPMEHDTHKSGYGYKKVESPLPYEPLRVPDYQGDDLATETRNTGVPGVYPPKHPRAVVLAVEPDRELVRMP